MNKHLESTPRSKQQRWRRCVVLSATVAAVSIGATVLAGVFTAPERETQLSKTVDAVFGILTARAQQSGAKSSITKRQVRHFLSKAVSVEQLLKKHGLARVIVKYKMKAPKVPAPGIATRLWYEGWKMVGLPAAAPPKALGLSKFIRKDVNETEFKALRSNPEIEHVFADVPIPPALSESSKLVRTDMDKLLALSDRPERQTHAAVILDTGVETDHPFLKGAVLNDLAACFSTEQLSPPFISESLCPGGVSELKQAGAAEPCDKSIFNCDHGTHVAGIIAGWKGKMGNKEFHGVGPEVPIIPVQIYSKITANDVCGIYGLQGPCVLSFISNQVEALEYARELQERGVPIGAVNMSLSAGNYAQACDADNSAKLIADKIGELTDAKIPVVISAGNEGVLDTVGMPGCVTRAVTVAATGDQGKLAINFPSGGGSNYSNLVDVAAPGVDIMSSVPGRAFQAKSGTSMAAPHVAAALAHARSKQSQASVTDLVAKLATMSSIDAVHPVDTAMKRPVVQFPAKELAAAAGATRTLGIVAPAGGISRRAGSTPSLHSLFAKSNRLIVDYGSQISEADQQRIIELLKTRGINVVDTQNKTSRLGVIVTEKPVSTEILNSLASEAGVKGLYRDIPLPLGPAPQKKE